jgi:predicted N-acyltransferase
MHARESNSETSIYRAVVYRSIHEIDVEVWDAIRGHNSLVRSHAYLAAVEAASVNDCEYFYPVIADEDGQVVAHACVYTIVTDFSQLLPKSLAWLPGVIRRAWKNFLHVKITECASPLSASHSISVLAGADRKLLIGKLGAAIDSIARSQHSTLVVVRDFLTVDREDFDVLMRNGYNLVSNMPLARIRVRWNSYDEYLSSMRSRYRKDVKRRLKRAENSGQEVCILKSFSEQSQLWVEQARTVYENSKGFKREILPSGYYENMDSKLGEKSVIVAAKRNGRYVAHGMVLHDDSDTIATYFGRNRGPASHEWFHLVNEVIRIGIDRKSTYINLGLGSYDAKSNVGADVEPLFVYSKSVIAPVNWLMRLVPQTMDYPVREPKRVFHD